MAYEREECCYGCAECVGCGRKYWSDYIYATCDECEQELDDEHPLKWYKGKMICINCYLALEWDDLVDVTVEE